MNEIMRDAAGLPRSAEGVVALVEVVGRIATLRGWALDGDGKAVNAFRARYGAIEADCTVVGRIDRPDVVANRRPGAEPNCGIALTVDLAAVAGSAPDGAHLEVLAIGGASAFSLKIRHAVDVDKIVARVMQTDGADRYPRAFAQPKSHSEYIRGDSFLDELKFTPHIHDIETVFDVGANVGQTMAELRRHLPNARIYCFEPVRATFMRLSAKAAADPKATAEHMALGDVSETRRIAIQRESVNNSLVFGDGAAASEEVMVRKGDDYCRDNGVETIDILKIDTEGFDLHVMKGFSQMLGARRIRFIETEVGMNRGNAKHVYFADIARFLDHHGYDVFGIYEQVRETNRKALLRRSNFVFGLR